MKNILIAIATTLFLLGCFSDKDKYTSKSEGVKEEAVVLQYQYNITKGLVQAQREMFSDSEWEILERNRTEVAELFEKYKALIADGNVAITVTEVRNLWYLVTTSYARAKRVTSAYIDDFPPNVNAALVELDVHMEEADRQVRKSLREDSSDQEVKESLMLVLNTLSTAAKIMSVGMVLL